MYEHDESSENLLTVHGGLHMLCHALRDPVAVISLPHGAVLEVNRAFRRMFRVPKPLPIDFSMVSLAGPELARVLRRWDGSRPRLLQKLVLRGTEGQARLLPLPATFPLQAFFHFIPRRTVRRRQSAEQLQQLLEQRLEQIRSFERLRSIGEIAAVIVHELRTPLTTIKLAVDSVRRSAALDGTLHDRLDAALEQVDRLDRLLSRIRHWTRQMTLQPATLDMRETITAALRAVEGLLQGPQTTVTVAVEPDPLTIVADGERLIEAIQNVVVNAIEAMPHGGRVSITAARARRRRGWVELRIRDGGAGMPPDVLEKCFQPFFTTKSTGTGLGLSIVKKIVELHGGVASVKCADGKGTEVVLEFPSGTAP